MRDVWHVIARRQMHDESLTTQSTWLHGAQSSRLALILEFAVGGQPLLANYSVGQLLDAELVFFDGEPLYLPDDAQPIRLITYGDVGVMANAGLNSASFNGWRKPRSPTP